MTYFHLNVQNDSFYSRSRRPVYSNYRLNIAYFSKALLVESDFLTWWKMKIIAATLQAVKGQSDEPD